MSAGTCQFCKCTEANACTIPGGDRCSWFDAARTVCTAPACITAYFAQQRRKASEASAKYRKRSPGQIHELMRQEKNARQRAYRARKRDEKRRGAA